MKNKISVYELLGLIKDGKAPKKIKFCGEIFVFRNNTYEYEDGNISLFHEYKEYFAYETIEYLNDEVEILEEYKPTIEPITLDDWNEITYNENWELLKNDFNKNMKTIFDRLNKIIDYINEKEKENE